MSAAMYPGGTISFAKAGDEAFVSVRDHEIVFNTWDRENSTMRRSLGLSQEPRRPPLVRFALRATKWTLHQVSDVTHQRFMAHAQHEAMMAPLREENHRLRSAILLKYAN